ncbi:MAG TPA: SEC-C metal-binding domain-containing protein, partial [Myxococcota bacterium]|nr:SEC-C metal-binding domain-containing protein [Myxococcota bacterium]
LARLEVGSGASPEMWKAAVEKYRVQVEREREDVVACGGLFILGTERHESRRIDNQLRGRAGRQGDPGLSRFFLSLEDDLMRLFANDRMRGFMQMAGMKDEEPIEHRWVTRSIEEAQRRVEGHHFNMRKNLLEYDDVMNLQRKAVYELRRRALQGENARSMMLESIRHLCDDLMDEFIPASAAADQWDTPSFLRRIEEVFALTWEETPEALREFARVELQERLEKEATAAYEAKEAEVGVDLMRNIERQMLLFYADQFWKDHLLAIDRLRDGIGLRGYGQRNPLLEYKKEAYNMYMLMSSLRDEAVMKNLLRLQPQVAEAAGAGASKAMAQRMASGQLARELEAAAEEAQELPSPPPVRNPEPIVFTAPPPPRQPAKGAEARLFAMEYNIRRNDPCPCGSGLKFKKCCYLESEDPKKNGAAPAAEGLLAGLAAELAAVSEPAAPTEYSEMPPDPTSADVSYQATNDGVVDAVFDDGIPPVVDGAWNSGLVGTDTMDAADAETQDTSEAVPQDADTSEVASLPSEDTSGKKDSEAV